MFPYGMERRPDGAWLFFNRKYKPLGVVTSDWADWDDPRHKLRLKGLGPATLAKLDCDGKGIGDRIYFYNDGSNPESSAANMDAYLKKLRILLVLQNESD